MLTSNAPESKDSDFTWKDFQSKNNNELVSIFGNYLNRVFVLCNKFFDVAKRMGDSFKISYVSSKKQKENQQ